MVESTALTNLKQAIRYPGDGESDASTTNKLRHELLATTADRADVKVALQFAEDMRLTAVRQAEAYATSMTARPDTNWSPQNNMYSQAYVDGADDLMLRDMILAVVWTELKASGRGTLVTGEFSGCSNGKLCVLHSLTTSLNSITCRSTGRNWHTRTTCMGEGTFARRRWSEEQ